MTKLPDEIHLNNSVVAENTSGTNSVPDDLALADPSLITAKNSFFGTVETITGPGSTNNINGGGDPGLVVLRDNGGTTRTRNLSVSSALLDVGDNTLIPGGVTLDANGNARILDGTVDIGATESGRPPTLLRIERHDPVEEVTNADALTFRVTFSENVTGLSDLGDFVVSGTGSFGNSVGVTAVNQVAIAAYDVTVSGSPLADFEGTVGLDLSSEQNIVDDHGITLLGGEPAIDESYTLDNSGPTSTMVSPPRLPATSLFNFPGEIIVNTIDSAGIATVEIAVMTPFEEFYDGTSFSSSAPVYFTATELGNGNYSIPMNANAFPFTQNFFAQVRATDSAGNVTEGLLPSGFFGFTTDLVVDSAVDESDGDYSVGDRSLREAIELANGSQAKETIKFDASLAGQTITLNGQRLRVTDGLTIDASDLTGGLTVNANFQSGVLHASGGDDLTLRGLNITGGSSLDVGAGVRFESTGTLTIERSTVRGNVSAQSGGGILVRDGELSLRDSTVHANRSNQRGGGIAVIGGGATITGSTISGNRTDADWGGGLYANTGTVTIESSTITQNQSIINGGGLVTFGPTTFSNTIVAGNVASGPAPDFAGTGSNFAGDFNLLGTGDRVSGTANRLGFTFATAMLGSLADNGGPTRTHIPLPGSPLIDAGNSSLPTDQRGRTRPIVFVGVPNAPGGDGSDIGAVELQELPSLIVTTTSDVVVAEDGVTSLREAVDFANRQPGADTITFDPMLAGQTIYLSTDGNAIIIDDSVTIDGDIDNDGTADITIDADSGAGQDDADSAVISIVSTVDTTHQVTLEGLIIRDGNHSSGGGGIHVAENAGDLALINSSVLDNVAAEDGGGISSRTGNLTLMGSTVSGNSTTNTFGYGGGGIFAYSGSVTLTGSVVSGNTSAASASGAFSGGGGINTQTASVSLTNSRVSGNTSASSGGGIYSYSGSIALDNTTIDGNSAVNFDGGGIHSYSGGVTLTRSTVSGNDSGRDGGGIDSSRFGSLTLINSTVSGNTSGSTGGGLFVSRSVSIESSTIFANSSTGNGGGVLSFGSATINNSIVAGNSGGSVPNLAGPTSFTGDFNLVGPGDQVSGTGNRANIDDPLLGPLADNGGPTRTHALLPGSPAINAGDPNFDPNATTPPMIHDQRGSGFARIDGGRVDTGAFELQISPVTVALTRQDPGGEVTSADTLQFRAEFSEPVQSIDSADFTVSGGSTGGIARVVPIAGTGEAIYLITVSGGDLASFNGRVGIDLSPTQNITDLALNALSSDEPGVDETYLVDNTAPQVASVVLDDGTAQRSVIRSITVTFDSQVIFDAGALDLRTSAGDIVNVATDIAPGIATHQVVLRFPDAFGGTLADGNYRLRILETHIRDAAGQQFGWRRRRQCGGR